MVARKPRGDAVFEILERLGFGRVSGELETGSAERLGGRWAPALVGGWLSGGKEICVG
jgi:hypothetical protein